MVTAVDPANPNKLTMAKMVVDTGYCISCGLCVEACPYNALHMGYAFERANYRRKDLVQSNEGLLASETRKASAYMHPEMEKDLPEQTLLIKQIDNREKKKVISKPSVPQEPKPEAPNP